MPKPPITPEEKAARKLQASNAAKAMWARRRAANPAGPVARPADAPPDPPANYGKLPEAGLPGGAITEAERNIGGVGEAALNKERPLAPDMVGDMSEVEMQPPMSNARVKPPAFRKPPFDPPARLTKPAKSNGHVGNIAPTGQLASEGVLLQLPDWETCDLQEGQDSLDAAYALLQSAANALQKRFQKRDEGAGYFCQSCGNRVVDLRQAKMIKDVRDPSTGIFTKLVWCSPRCFISTVAKPGGERAMVIK